MLIRDLAGPAEATQVEELQMATWGRDPREVVPRGMLIALQLQGGLLAGAFDAERMVGFVLGFPTRDNRLQHSHMLAVLPEYRRSGTGVALKAFQRDWCLERGIERIEWTFDPLRAPNANFNLHRLGATIRRYYPDLYGEMSGINAGVPSDRALAEWHLGSERVTSALLGSLAEPEWSGVPVVNPDAPWGFDASLSAERLRFNLPQDFGALLSSDLAMAQRWREHGRQVLQHYLDEGYSVTGFGHTGGSAYLLERSGPGH